MTLSAGTVVLLAVVTVPTVKPAVVMAVRAAVCVKPTTFGTAGPRDTTKTTALPAATLLPGRRRLTDDVPDWHGGTIGRRSGAHGQTGCGNRGLGRSLW